VINLKYYNCRICKKKPKENCLKKKCKFKVKNNIPIFTNRKTSKITKYEIDNANLIYINFLKWLFKTFKTNEKKFREKIFQDIELKKKQKILITGIGTGSDLEFILKKFKTYNLKIFAQDLSYYLLESCVKKIKKKIYYNVSDARSLPFKNNFFDHVFHFGGINLFGNFSQCVLEMERVVKVGGSVTFGDESIAPWLRKTIYSEMLINNNKLWKFRFDLKRITLNAKDVNIKYLLGNCFYLVNYIFDPKYKNKFNYDVKHKSPRGGSILSRFVNHQKKFNRKYILKNLNERIKSQS
jgi:ubiquinone/menaquinone biosynthesis C-methylase UbiE